MIQDGLKKTVQRKNRFEWSREGRPEQITKKKKSQKYEEKNKSEGTER